MIRISQIENCRYKNVCLNISDYTELLKKFWQKFDPFTERENLRRGLYSKIGFINIFVAKEAEPGYMYLSDGDILSSKEFPLNNRVKLE